MSGFLSVTAYVPDRVSTLAVGLAGEFFGALCGSSRTPGFRLAFCAERPGAVRTDLGLSLPVAHDLHRLAKGELVLILPGDHFRDEPSPEIVGAIQEAHARGAVIASSCVGSFLLAATGLLDGLRATTHWKHAEEFAARHPAVTVLPDDLFVDEGQLVTGAGSGATPDMYLHLLRREHGISVANAFGRGTVMPPPRTGGQPQYLEAPVPASRDDELLTEVLAWAAENLHRLVPVEELAARAVMSPRTFLRRVKAATGTTPHAWLLQQRLARAEELLESTALPLDEIARRVGYANSAVLRGQFVKRRGIPPRAYRRAFDARRTTARTSTACTAGSCGGTTAGAGARGVGGSPRRTR
ncbi:transcriptional regulator, AraC family with amidase-like domain [Micromonospora citrea]|uniref:Transcriptional regulator, AraC family with amidase-like domain n=1 Tax=Micromonospora citrea TaxID=47855 RepID=A0A1C6U598_9ACTN|nr:helix-turn-helix domain-containing protein [Micromonospora citrea]SCL49164.1 transcriptional regulator, AraC family with amidase-like domain [Micromonospora citrea]